MLAEFFKRFKLIMMQHTHPYTINWLIQGHDICVDQQCRMYYDIKPLKDDVLCDVYPLEVCDVFILKPYMWKFHVVYESMPLSFIITLGDQHYRVPKAFPNTVLSLISTKHCRKVVSKIGRFFLCMIQLEGE